MELLWTSYLLYRNTFINNSVSSFNLPFILALKYTCTRSLRLSLIFFQLSLRSLENTTMSMQYYHSQLIRNSCIHVPHGILNVIRLVQSFFFFHFSCFIFHNFVSKLSIFLFFFLFFLSFVSFSRPARLCIYMYVYTETTRISVRQTP